MTERDLELIEWLAWVRLADTESVRLFLGAVAGRAVSGTVATRRIAALRSLGLVETARPLTRGSQVVWATKQATGYKAASPYGALANHSLAVATTTAWAMTGGARSAPDRASGLRGDRLADGVLMWSGEVREFIEAELSLKQPSRVATKLKGMRQRWNDESVAGTLYVTRSLEIERLIRRVADEVLGTDSSRVRILQLEALSGPTIAHASPPDTTARLTAPEASTSSETGRTPSVDHLRWN